MTPWVWDLNQLENVHVDISDIRYCMSGFSTCYMKSQAEVQSQQGMYGSKLVMFEILHNS